MADIRATSSGNTTPLGAGEGTSFTARDFRDANAKMISQTIARENYRSKTLSNAKLGELRKYVFKMVTGWTNDTKMRIISEYGDMSQLRSSNPEEVNRQVTETLIINLKPEDAEILLRDIKVNERKLYSDVSSIQRSRTKLSSQYRRLSRFSAKTMNEVAADLGASFRVNKLRRELRRYDVTFKIPKKVITQFKRLRKELIDVLNDLYNRVEINNLALRMDIDIQDRTTQRQIRNLIINKTLLYVSLIVGKTRKGYSNAFLATQPFEELLRYTSYSYVTGKPPVTNEEIKEKMLIAIKAKALFSSKKAPTRAGYALISKEDKRILKAAKFFKKPVTKQQEDLKFSLPSELSEERSDLARIAGLAPGASLGKINKKVDSISRNELKQEKKISKLKDKKELLDEEEVIGPGNKFEEVLQRIFGTKQSRFQNKIEKAEEKYSKIKEKSEFFRKRKELRDIKSQEMGDKIPYVKIGDTGMESKNITKAVPVYVINEWMKQRVVKSEETKETNERLDELKKKNKGIFSLFGRKKRIKEITGLEYEKVQSLSESFPEEIESESKSDSGSFWDKMTINIGSEAVDKLEDNHAVKVYDMSSLRLKRDQEKNAITAGFVISDYAKSSGLNKIKKELATPVFVVNKQESIKDILIAIANRFGLGEVATSFASENAGELVNRIIGYSTGGRGRYVGGNKTSQFISGDSRNKSPNPEQVSINWDRKTYNVKPIPQFADGGSQRATSGQVTRMTAGERNMPMSVGISSHTITYNRSLGKDVKDNGSNEALKVYSVNPGLSDLLEVNGKSVSAIGLMSDMTDRLSRIEGLLAIGNEQRNAVATATAATAALIPKLANKSGGSNPFAGGGFTSELDDILKGR